MEGISFESEAQEAIRRIEENRREGIITLKPNLDDHLDMTGLANEESTDSSEEDEPHIVRGTE